jgi:exonuclease V gamma subunit
VSDYDVIVLGTGVRMTMVYRRWRKILKQKAIKDKQLFLFLSSGMAAEDPDKAVEKYLQPLVEKYDLTVNSMISFPGKIPDKWAKYDDAPKEKMNPQLAESWADNIANTIQKNK